MKTDPKLYFAIDNCFASKRWTQPKDWMDVIRKLGIRYVEASADTECDPLYMGGAYIADWIREVRTQSERTGIVVKNLYSGHGTYATLGLAHTDSRVRKRFLQQWMEAQADTAKALEAGLGFFAHGFDDSILQDAEAYEDKLEELYDLLAELAAYGRKIGIGYIGLEQMYSPHQPPWTVEGTKELLRQVYKRSGVPFYITNDVGHMNGQQYFQKPTGKYIRMQIKERKSGRKGQRVWMGSKAAMKLYYDASKGKISADDAVKGILEDCEKNPQLFAKPEDGSCYYWIEQLGGYSPIVHLQQNDGKSSPHWPFDSEHNAKGIIEGEKVIRSLGVAFAREQEADMPPLCEEVVLTLEPFIGTAGNNYLLLEEIAESVTYWRKYIPRDGMCLSEALALL